MSNLYKQYQEEGKKKLAHDLSIKNVMAIPRLKKVVVNIGLGEALVNKKAIETMNAQLSAICGQKPVVCVAKHDISSFKLRRGEPIGLKVTLREKRMYDFVEKFVKIVLPRIRDFRGISDSGLDGKGNYTLGLSEQIVFPEIEYSQVDKIRGLEITFVTSAKNNKEAKRLLEVLGMPFARSMERAQGKP
ncbi:50S ribosomal protein L5 [Candidatus Gottesmanbacteria bacterium]|nr:50S ribosomal protein L5 [Candidatus Gottesmanbacteria bacterium]MBI5452249.1 50S ribosomal protein L5 [Candidatus Gottesmanbacteria bacterium]